MAENSDFVEPSKVAVTEVMAKIEAASHRDRPQVENGVIDPRNVYLAIPCGDGRLMSETAGSVIQCMGLFGAISMPAECSHVSLVRNIIADQFLQSPFEWLICIDSDIRFRREDLLMLLQPKDPTAVYADSVTPAPTRIDTAVVSGTRTMADVLVVAEYSYKNDLLEPVKRGMGFVRIHRSVFRTLEQLKHDHGTVNIPGELWDRLLDSQWLEANDHHLKPYGPYVLKDIQEKAEDTRGAPRLWTTRWRGRQFYDYFPSGPLLSQFIPTQEWMGEDHGFFTLSTLAGIIARNETRTRLVHIGRKAYEYQGPQTGAGQ